MSACEMLKRLMECSVEESKIFGCWTKGRGQRAKTNYCAWQIGSMNYGKKEWTGGSCRELNY